MKPFVRMLPEAVCFIAIVMLVGWLASCVCGCAAPPVAEPKYPEYHKWWTGSEPRRSTNLSELGQGDILVFENGQEALLL